MKRSENEYLNKNKNFNHPKKEKEKPETWKLFMSKIKSTTEWLIDNVNSVEYKKYTIVNVNDDSLYIYICITSVEQQWSNDDSSEYINGVIFFIYYLFITNKDANLWNRKDRNKNENNPCV